MERLENEEELEKRLQERYANHQATYEAGQPRFGFQSSGIIRVWA